MILAMSCLFSGVAGLLIIAYLHDQLQHARRTIRSLRQHVDAQADFIEQLQKSVAYLRATCKENNG